MGNVTESLLQRIEKSLDSIRPYLQVDGGNIEVVEVSQEMTLRVKFTGACENCDMSYTTMKAGVEQVIKQEVPEIKEIVAINSLT